VVLLVGVAASSTFQHVRDARLRPGQSARVGNYDVRYVRPTSAIAGEKVSLGAVLDVSQHGRHVATLRPSRGYYPSLDQAALGRIGRFFKGDSTSELGLQAGLGRDIWTAVQPDLSSIEPYIARSDRSFPDANPQLEGFLVSTMVARYLKDAPPAEFRLIVSPLVGWIWFGGSIVVGGALMALWPARRAVRFRPVARSAPGLAQRPAPPRPTEPEPAGASGAIVARLADSQPPPTHPPGFSQRSSL
jgi:cytochrome c-type biogenesis protein CcmF